jgi:hypothetical protein
VKGQAMSTDQILFQDWGGPIGLGFAARRPELITRVHYWFDHAAFDGLIIPR